MNTQEALKNKAECMLAWLRGEPIECAVATLPNGEPCQWIPVSIPPDGVPVFSKSGDRYRIAPKPQPKFPDGVFWVRGKADLRGSMFLVTIIRMGGLSTMEGPGPFSLEGANEELYWSYNRKDWFTFTGEKVE